MFRSSRSRPSTRRKVRIPSRARVGRQENLRHPSVAGCIRCHKVGDKGGIIGPALDGIASRKDADYIQRALVNPTAELAEGFDKLGASPMPPMNIILNDQELADVMAYLLTLKDEK